MGTSGTTRLRGSGSGDWGCRRRRRSGRDRVRKGTDVICAKGIRAGGVVTDDMRKIRLRVCGRPELERGWPSMFLPAGSQS
jgi:hypothetical protein